MTPEPRTVNTDMPLDETMHQTEWHHIKRVHGATAVPRQRLSFPATRDMGVG